MICELSGHSSWVYQAEFMPGDRELVTAGFDKKLKLWSLESCSEIMTYNGHTDKVMAVSVHPSGNSFVSGGMGFNFHELGCEVSQCVVLSTLAPGKNL